MANMLKLSLILITLLPDPEGQDRYFDPSYLQEGTAVRINLQDDQSRDPYDPVYLMLDTGSAPMYYFQHLFTPVCSDTLCKPVHITLMWDLAGNYRDFLVTRQKPLTKLDHAPFSSRDYEKLQGFDPRQFQDDFIRILSNNNSFLANRVLTALPGELAENDHFAERLWKIFRDLHFQTQNLALRQLSNNQELPDAVINDMIVSAAGANETQYIMYLKVFMNQHTLTPQQVESLMKLAEDRTGRLGRESILSLETVTPSDEMEPVREKIIQILSR